ncbi:S8 family peptidase [Metabacillus iocasae]|uniref:Major intracellular serine protease n=1 Tax=Priestia iocasae TaxID=2291674 RepID=A0ABS2QUK1_9BACI|nr:S8 family peptidase [Metabacillus iocasae]MBM7702184.1 major intracellular serine protease [Metabacillus iocasae]
MGKVGLIPYRVQAVMSSTKTIPPGIQMIEAPALWKEGYKGEGIVIAILDTGCEMNHSELKERIVDGYNFTSDDEGNPKMYQDYNGHGTHVAGTIGATENEEGVIGVAPLADLLILKVLSKDGFGTNEWVTAAIYHAINWRGPNGEKVRIISMSLGGKVNDSSLHEAIKKAVQEQILVVCAAGNEGDGKDKTNEYAYPGAYNEVVQVGSVNLKGEISKFSNTNDEIDLVAPGEEVLSTYLENEYAVLSGTSMATPHVSGAAALIIEKWESKMDKPLSEPALYEQIIKHTVELSYSRKYQGNGLLKLSGQKQIDKIKQQITTA